MKVGREPVVRPLMRCIVTVGASDSERTQHKEKRVSELWRGAATTNQTTDTQRTEMEQPCATRLIAQSIVEAEQFVLIEREWAGGVHRSDRLPHGRFIEVSKVEAQRVDQ
jgi:hypothetical protein